MSKRAKRKLMRRLMNEVHAQHAKAWAKAPKSALAYADHCQPINRAARRALTRRGKSKS